MKKEKKGGVKRETWDWVFLRDNVTNVLDGFSIVLAVLLLFLLFFNPHCYCLKWKDFQLV